MFYVFGGICFSISLYIYKIIVMVWLIIFNVVKDQKHWEIFNAACSSLEQDLAGCKSNSVGFTIISASLIHQVRDGFIQEFCAGYSTQSTRAEQQVRTTHCTQKALVEGSVNIYETDGMYLSLLLPC